MGDTELGGQRIKAGDALIVGIAPANTDPVVRPDLDANMEGNRAHLAFSGGPHECPGQDIGRAIADVGVDALLMRLPDLELAVDESELRWVGNLMGRHLVELPAEFAPRAPQDDREPPSMGKPNPARQDWEVQSAVRHVAPTPVRAPALSEPAGAVPGVRPAGATVAVDGSVEGSAAGMIPQQRRPAAPARLWRVVTRWWNGH